MIELLEFIFQTGWHFFGFILIMAVALEGIADIVKSFKKPEE